MNKILKTTALCLCAATLFSTTAMAKSYSVPVRDTFEKAGFSISWDQENKCVTLEKGSFKHCEKVGENIFLDYDKTFATEEFAKSIIEQCTREELSSKATVTETGEGYFIANTEKMGEVKFLIDENTFFHHEVNKMLYTAEDITVGSLVKVYYSEAMTRSLPPQTYAKEVVFLNSEANVEEKEALQAFTVTEKGENYILAKNETMGEVMFRVNEETFFHHEKNRRLYTIEDVEIGTTLKIDFSQVMTASIPPQVTAYEVIFTDNEEGIGVESVTSTGKVTEIGEDFFVIETENGGYRFNCDEETFFHHAVNKRLYTLFDIEKDMEVEVMHSNAATMSIPPQSYAIEVIIK
ncbi:MAG: hypothetical protein ACI3XA_02060 [Clostridia bacterium]